MQTAQPALETPELRLDITTISYLAFTVCTSMVTTPNVHLLRRPRAQRRPRQASPSQLNLLATDPSLRTSRPPPCRILPGRSLETAEHLVRQSLFSPIAMVRSCLQFCPSLSSNGSAYRMAEPLSSTKSENCEVDYLFVARRRILKLRSV